MSDLQHSEKKKSAPVFQFLNNMVRNFFYQLQYTEIGRSGKYFDPQSRQHLDGAEVSIFRGYSSSFAQLEGGLFCRIDPAVKVVRSESVLDVVNAVYKRNSAFSREEKRQLVEEELRGKMVMANYGRNNCYIIDGLTFDASVETHRFDKDGEEMNLTEYYRRHYDVDIKAKKQPLVRATV